MTASGQSRRFERAPITSVPRQRPDLLDADWLFRGVPPADFGETRSLFRVVPEQAVICSKIRPVGLV
jgi:hypothetical protein